MSAQVRLSLIYTQVRLSQQSHSGIDIQNMPERRISSLYDLNPGDHIQTLCELQAKKKNLKNVFHHLLVVKVISDKQLLVIHNDGIVVVEETKVFSPKDIIVLEYPCAYTAQQAIERARSQCGKEWKLLTDNCEHLVTWAKNGKGKSPQVLKGAAAGAAGGVFGAAAGGLIAAAISSGAVAGSIVPGFGTLAGAAVGGIVGIAGGVYWYTQ